MRFSALDHLQREIHRRMQGLVLEHLFAVDPHRCTVVAADDQLDVLFKFQFRFEPCGEVVYGYALFGRGMAQYHTELAVFRRRDRRPLQLCAVKISRFYGLRIIAFRNGCGVPSRDGLDQNVAAEHILVGTPECFFIVRIVPPERLEDRLAPHITFIGALIDHGQQAIAQVIVLPHDPERFLVVCPRVAIAFDGVRTMRAEHGRKRAELHPTEEHLFIGIADMPAAVRVAIRHAVVGRSEHGRDLLRKRIGIAQDIPRPLNGIAMARAVAYPLIASVGDIHHIAHDHGATINLSVRPLLIKVLGNF